MMVVTHLSLAYLLTVSVEARKNYGKKMDPNGPYEHIVSLRPHEAPGFLASSLPASLDWRNLNGVDYTSQNVMQHAPGPTYCGACYAFATVAHLNDRFNIAKGNTWPKTSLSVQVLITCGASMPTGCGGGDPSSSLKFIHEYGLPDDTCHSYQAQAGQCNALAVCQDCMTGYEPMCWARRHFPIYRVSEYGKIVPEGSLFDSDLDRRQGVIDNMVVRMKAEISARGPIVCQIACPDPTKITDVWHSRGYMDDYTPFYNDEGVNFEPHILHNTNFTCASGNWDTCVDHDVSVSGWGQEKGVPYWIIRNSWGSWWGENGWFRIIMGINNLGIESACFFGVPDLTNMKTDASGMQRFLGGTQDVYADRFAKAEESSDDKVVYM